MECKFNYKREQTEQSPRKLGQSLEEGWA